MEDLTGRVALVTGGSGGIGAAICRALAEAGAAVAVHYARNADAAKELVAELPKGVALSADLADPQSPASLVEAAQTQLGPIDILVANAGVSLRRALEELTLEDWERTHAVNLRAPFLLCQEVVPGMRERSWGRILFTSSVAAFTGGIVGPHDASSKSGLHGLTHSLASRLAGQGITVNAIAPALIAETGMLPGSPEALREAIPVGRLGRPQECADLAMALLTNAYLTNQVVLLDGGMHPR